MRSDGFNIFRILSSKSNPTSSTALHLYSCNLTLHLFRHQFEAEVNVRMKFFCNGEKTSLYIGESKESQRTKYKKILEIPMEELFLWCMCTLLLKASPPCPTPLADSLYFWIVKANKGLQNFFFSVCCLREHCNEMAFSTWNGRISFE